MPLAQIGRSAGLGNRAAQNIRERRSIQSRMSQARDIVASLDDEQRKEFLDRYNALASEKKNVVLNRLMKIGEKQEKFSRGFVPQFITGLSGKTPSEQFTQPKGFAGKAGRTIGGALPGVALSIPFLGAAGAIPKIPQIARAAIGLGAASGVGAATRKQPILPAAAAGAGAGLLFGGLGKLGASAIPKKIPGAERLGSALGGGLAGAITAEEGKELQGALTMAGLGALFPSTRFKPTGRYTKNKVLQIRDKTKIYRKKEIKAYGDSIDSLPNEVLDGAPVLEKMEQMLVQRQIFTQEGRRVGRPLTTADSKLLKAYDSLSRKWAASPKGTLEARDVVNEYRNIKGKFTKRPTPQSRLQNDTAIEMFEGVKPQIKSDVFQNANSRYRVFKQNEEAINKHFDIWGNPNLTGKGESTLLSLFKPEQKDVGRLAEQITGVDLGGARLRSGARQVIQNPLLRYGALIGAGSLAGFGAGRGFRQ